MGNMANTKLFNDLVRKHLRPGDEAALARYATMLRKIEQHLQGVDDGTPIMVQAIAVGGISFAADTTQDAVTVLLTSAGEAESHHQENNKRDIPDGVQL